jgi:hypothetical protein
MHGSSSVSHEIDVNEIAVEGYTFLYPLVMMEVTRRHISSTDRRSEQQKTSNLFIHNHEMASDKWRAVARSNIDTLFSSAWIDLSEGPATITLPPAGDRYHMFQMLDMWTDTYAVVGSRTIGQNGGTVTLVGPAHAQSHQSTAHEIVIHCPTPTTWIIGRSYAQNGPDLQDAIQFVDAIVGTSEFAQKFSNSVAYPGDESSKIPPVTKVRNLSGQEFFEFASRILRREGIRNTDGSIALRLRALGFVTDEDFVVAAQSEQVQTAISEAPRIFTERIRKTLNNRGPATNGWSTTQADIGTYGNSYVLRAAVALIGLAANPTVDAVYIAALFDANNDKLEGSRSYVLHFNKDEFPPANAFWSLTAYDHEGFMISNPLNRFGIRSRDAVEYNEDGSLDIYFAPACPPEAPESNWIPSIAGSVALQMRLYSPAEAYLNGTWKPPVIQRIDA